MTYLRVGPTCICALILEMMILSLNIALAVYFQQGDINNKNEMKEN